jgi:hypothetical protein
MLHNRTQHGSVQDILGRVEHNVVHATAYATEYNYTVKKGCGFPFPCQDVISLTKLSLAGNNQIFPGQGEFDIPPWDGKTANLFTVIDPRRHRTRDTRVIYICCTFKWRFT